jgi:hypothetical protein
LNFFWLGFEDGARHFEGGSQTQELGRGFDAGRSCSSLDRSEAVHAAVTRTWGSYAVIRRFQVRKKRNVKAHVFEKHWPELERRLSEA